jgi:hypothetical protein
MLDCCAAMPMSLDGMFTDLSYGRFVEGGQSRRWEGLQQLTNPAAIITPSEPS